MTTMLLDKQASTASPIATTELTLIILLPHLIFVTFNLTSLAGGLVLTAIIFFLFTLQHIINLKVISRHLLYTSTSIGILISYAAYSFISTGSFKPFISLVILFTLGMSLELGNHLAKLEYDKILGVLNIVALILLALGWSSLAIEPNLFNYSLLEKPIFPFSEESHFALSIGMISIAVISIARVRLAVFYTVNLAALSILLPNLTLLVFSIISAIVLSLRARPLFLFPALVIFATATAITIALSPSTQDYFASRLNLEDPTNLSTMVWIQGWELAITNFVETKGVGLGFQALGLSTTTLPEISEKIIHTSGVINNLTDGGFLASKLISEFGLIGLIISMAFAYFIIKYTFMLHNYHALLRKSPSNPNNVNIKKKIILLSLAFPFLVEFFLRGYGYFSPGLIIAFAAMVALIKLRYKRNHNENINFK